MKVLRFFTQPKIWFVAITLSAAIVFFVLGILFLAAVIPAGDIVGYVFLGIATVTAVYSVYGVIKVFPDIRVWAEKRAETHPFWNRLLSEYSFRTIVLTVASFVINISFAAYNTVIAILYSSVWFGVLAAYYFLLVVIRGIIVTRDAFRRRAERKGRTEKALINDTKTYGACGIALVLLPIALSIAVSQIVGSNEQFAYTGVIVYVFAVYAFAKTAFAIFNFVKSLGTQELMVKAASSVAVADALVSILALQTAMLAEFGNDGINAPLMNAVTGAAVCAVTLSLGIYMFIRSVQTLIKKRSDA